MSGHGEYRGKRTTDPEQLGVQQGLVLCRICEEPLMDHALDKHRDLLFGEVATMRNRVGRLSQMSPAERKRRQRKRQKEEKQ